MYVCDDVFLNDTTTRRKVLADSIGPLVTAGSVSEQVPGWGQHRRHLRRHSVAHRRGRRATKEWTRRQVK